MKAMCCIPADSGTGNEPYWFDGRPKPYIAGHDASDTAGLKGSYYF